MSRRQIAIKIARETRLAKLLFKAMNNGQGKEKLETLEASFNTPLLPHEHIKGIAALRSFIKFNGLTITDTPETIIMDDHAELFASLITANNEDKTRKEISEARRRRMAEILLEANGQKIERIPVAALYPLFKGKCAFNSLPNLHVFVNRLNLTVSNPGAGNGRVRNIEICAKALEFIHKHLEMDPYQAELHWWAIHQLHQEDSYCDEFAPVGDSIFTNPVTAGESL